MSGGFTIAIGALWVLIWLGIRNGLIPLPPPGRVSLGRRLPSSQRTARWLGYAGVALIAAGTVMLLVGAGT